MGNLYTTLFESIFGKLTTEAKTLIVGIDAAGKTTILYKFKLGEVVNTIPTIGFNVETLDYKNLNFIVWDCGSYSVQRFNNNIFRHFCTEAKGVIFVIDSSDREDFRISDAKQALFNAINMDELKTVPLLVFANKQDLPNAMSAGEVTDKLDLRSVTHSNWYVQEASAKTGDGLYEGLEWFWRKVAESENKNTSRS